MPTTRSQKAPATDSSVNTDPASSTQEVSESTKKVQWKLTLYEPDMRGFALKSTVGSSSAKKSRGAYDTTNTVEYKENLEYWRQYLPPSVKPIAQKEYEDLSTFCKRVETYILKNEILRSETEPGANIGVWALHGSVQRVTFEKTEIPATDKSTG